MELLIEGDGSKAHITIPKAGNDAKSREQIKKLKGKKRHYKKEYVKAKGEA